MYIILDRGHGVDTPGKRSKVWDNGKQLIEWEFNEKVIRKVEEWLKLNPHLFKYTISPRKDKDVHVTVRKYMYERIAKRTDEEVLVISVHGDAFHSQTAKGGTCFTSKGLTKSDKFEKEFKKSFEHYDLPVRSSREANFTILTGKGYYAVLLEMGFYTNFEECMFMLSDDGVIQYANVIIRGLNEIHKKHIQCQEE